MGRIDRLARELATDRRGLVRTSTLHAEGVAWSTIARRVDAGTWERPHHGVVDVTCEGWDWERRVIAAVLACRTGTVASHRTAAALHDLPGFPRSGRVEVTAPRRGRTNTLPFTIHSTLHVEEPVVIDSVPCASPVRTLQGLGTVVGDRALARAVRDALRRGLVDLAALHAPALDALPGMVRVREMARRELEASMLRQESPLEGDVIDRLLVVPGLPRFRTQETVVAGGRELRIDIAWPRLRIAVEVDGGRWHADELARLADDERQQLLEEDGWVVLRVSAADLADARAWERFVARLRAAVSLAQQER